MLTVNAQELSLRLSEEPISPISPISPIPYVSDLDDNKVALGKRLFNDTNLSSDGTISCASCHNLAQGGDDGFAVSFGVKGRQGTFNAPTVLNSSLLFRQFWDGRAASLEEQISATLMNPVEMDMDWTRVLSYLAADFSYVKSFKQAYQQGPTKSNASDAIAEFERSLLTPDGDFDRYLKGDELAITEQAKKGYKLFKSYGCVSCHQGMAVGGNLYEKLGVFKPYYDESDSTASLGRYLITANEENKFEFKVPSLRNVARTAPYLHDGSIETLEEVISLMAKYQLGRDISESDVAYIKQFLQTLNGEINEK